MNTVNVSISSFASAMGFCQYRIINEFHLGMKQKTTYKMMKGKMVHWELEQKDLLIPRREATQEELMNPNIDLDFAREKIQVAIQRENVNRFIYRGVTDKIVRINGDVYVYDDKVTSNGKCYVSNDKILQLCAYCEGFLRNYSHMIKFNRIFFKLIFRDSEGKVIEEYTKEYTDEFKKFLIKNFELFESIFNKTKPPAHHHNPKKCMSCGFLHCKERINV